MPDDRAIFDISRPPEGTRDWDTMKAAQTLGDLFKWHYADADYNSYRPLTLRANLAVTDDELTEHVRRLNQCATTLASIYPTN